MRKLGSATLHACSTCWTRNAEAAFDEIVQLAATLCHVPVALISFVDRDRQWFKAAHGWRTRSTTARLALCALTILEADQFVVEDTHADPRIVGHPILVAHPDVRFYAGVPLRVEPTNREQIERSGIGARRVIDNQPRTLNSDELSALRILARQTERLLTERQLAEHASVLSRKAVLRHRYTVVTELMLCGVVVLAGDGSIESANPAAEAILGLTLDQYVGVHQRMRRGRPFTLTDHRFRALAEHPAFITVRDHVEIRDVVMGVTRADGRGDGSSSHPRRLSGQPANPKEPSPPSSTSRERSICVTGSSSRSTCSNATPMSTPHSQLRSRTTSLRPWQRYESR